ncbi:MULTISPECIES: hypothetical protein [unclassified Streptomyces]|uniref:hypothetical protein n=1 Tax=unclassified Streptomyces TaxID=2593676 RepID=UPI002257885B|nr:MULTISPECIES: hypothetical protein [unclassified Streptomyces]MCX5328198.1 hypothetical protein [Streptomyces sp. NBC_00140]MCX5357606.1 hypothetical protein [Streptomyces sp. NBC_00124]
MFMALVKASNELAVRVLNEAVASSQRRIGGKLSGTGALAARAPVELGRYDDSGRLRYTGRTPTLGAAVRHALADQLRAGDAGHPWTGRSFSVGWGSREQLSVHLVVPEVVAEVAVDVARDSAGRWRHPVRLTGLRTDMGTGEVALFGAAV